MGETGSVVMVVGGASGIGLATARRLATGGARVAIADLDVERAREVAAELPGALALHTDVGEPASLDAAFAAAGAALGPVDQVVLSAGISISSGPLGAVSDDTYRKMMRVNVDGVVFGVRAALRALGLRGGSVVVLGSLGGILPIPTDPIYALTKHAVVGFVRSLPPGKVRVNLVCPGMVDTPLLDAKTRRYLQAVRYPFIPVEDVAALVAEVLRGNGHAGTWILQPGLPPWDEAAPAVAGPRIETWGKKKAD